VQELIAESLQQAHEIGTQQQQQQQQQQHHHPFLRSLSRSLRERSPGLEGSLPAGLGGGGMGMDSLPAGLGGPRLGGLPAADLGLQGAPAAAAAAAAAAGPLLTSPFEEAPPWAASGPGAGQPDAPGRAQQAAADADARVAASRKRKGLRDFRSPFLSGGQPAADEPPPPDQQQQQQQQQQQLELELELQRSLPPEEGGNPRRKLARQLLRLASSRAEEGRSTGPDQPKTLVIISSGAEAFCSARARDQAGQAVTVLHVSSSGLQAEGGGGIQAPSGSLHLPRGFQAPSSLLAEGEGELQRQLSCQLGGLGLGSAPAGPAAAAAPGLGLGLDDCVTPSFEALMDAAGGSGFGGSLDFSNIMSGLMEHGHRAYQRSLSRSLTREQARQLGAAGEQQPQPLQQQRERAGRQQEGGGGPWPWDGTDAHALVDEEIAAVREEAADVDGGMLQGEMAGPQRLGVLSLEGFVTQDRMTSMELVRNAFDVLGSMTDWPDDLPVLTME
jgi:hypothetical protein